MVRMRELVNQTGAIGAALLSLLTATGALAASSCCALPLALSIAGFSGAWLGGLSQLVVYRPHFLTAAALALLVGWIVALRRRSAACRAACARPAQSWLAFGALTVSTLLVGMAAGWEWIEPAVMSALLRLAEGMA